jgi:hypothetical protein
MRGPVEDEGVPSDTSIGGDETSDDKRDGGGAVFGIGDEEGSPVTSPVR